MTKILILHLVSKVGELVAKDSKSLVIIIALPSFVIKIIDIGLNSQDNDPVFGFQGSGTGC